jgi:hypothetical protein
MGDGSEGGNNLTRLKTSTGIIYFFSSELWLREAPFDVQQKFKPRQHTCEAHEAHGAAIYFILIYVRCDLRISLRRFPGSSLE